MTHLGSFIRQWSESGDAALLLDGTGDVLLLERVAVMSSRFDETPEDYVAAAPRRYSLLATSEDWLALMSAMERSDDPARTALKAMVEWALSTDAREIAPGQSCSCSGKPHTHHR